MSLETQVCIIIKLFGFLAKKVLKKNFDEKVGSSTTPFGSISSQVDLELHEPIDLEIIFGVFLSSFATALYLGKLVLNVSMYGCLAKWGFTSLWNLFFVSKYKTFSVVTSHLVTHMTSPELVLQAIVMIASSILLQNLFQLWRKIGTCVSKETKKSKNSSNHLFLYDEILLEYEADDNCYCAIWIGLF